MAHSRGKVVLEAGADVRTELGSAEREYKSATSRTLQINAVSSKQLVPRVERGHSNSYRHLVVSLGPLGKVVVDLQASATISWSAGRGKPSVGFNPRTGAVSVSDHGLSFTDPGVLGKLASAWRHDPLDARALLATRRFGFSDPVADARPFSVSFGGAKHPRAVAEVTNSATITLEHGLPALEIETSTAFSVNAAHGQQASVNYSITTTYSYQGPKATRLEVTEALLTAFTIATALYVGQSGAGEPPPVVREP